jgi:hypothetical protein
MSLRIHFERSGGIAGPATRRACTIDADELPSAEAGELHDLVRAADLAAPTSQPSGGARPVRPDSFHYRLVIDHEGRRHTIEAGENDLPASLRPLVKWLTKRASPGGA